MNRLFALLGAVLGVIAQADMLHPVLQQSLFIPVTPFSNMASGYQATNPGFKAILKTENKTFLAGGAITLDSVMAGYSDDASSGSMYGRLVLQVSIDEVNPSFAIDEMQGRHSGYLSICMVNDPDGSLENTKCKNLTGNLHPERPFQWLDKQVIFEIDNGDFRIVQYFGKNGDGGTKEQIALAVYHPAFGFAAPAKAFKDYQSPLVLDLDSNQTLDLTHVWDNSRNVRFDWTGEKIKTRTGWVQPRDGFLFEDLGAGCALDGTNLFGEFTRSKDGSKQYENGFDALAKLYDTEGRGFVEPARHPSLKVWRDKNQDGLCTKDEVVAASQLVKRIELKYRNNPSSDLVADNEVRFLGEFTDAKGARRTVGDVYFKQRRYELAKGN